MNGRSLGWSARRGATVMGAALLGSLALVAGSERAHEHASARPQLPRTVAEALGLTAPGVAQASQPAAWDLTAIGHERIDYWIGRFQTDKRADFETYLARTGRYASLIASALSSRNMPQDLLYLAMIESGFDPKAYSRAKASGLWQFISGTARRYDLDINRAVDERNDPVKATRAALDYLTDLYDRFESWHLAAAAYNTGENRVGRIMREVTGTERGTDADYYRIWDRLPKETRDYVPLMAAAARISKDPPAYGFEFAAQQAPLAFAEVVARPATPLKSLARRAGTTVMELKALNPHLKLERTRNDQPMVVRVPPRGPGEGVATVVAAP